MGVLPAAADSSQANLSLVAPVNAVLGPISCPSANTCLSVGTTRPTTQEFKEGAKSVGAVVTVLGGRPGPVRPVGGPFFRLSGVSCPSVELCFAVGSSDPISQNSAAVVTIHRGLPSAAVSVPGATYLSGISCRAQTCVAVGAELLPETRYEYDAVVVTLVRGRPAAVYRVPEAQDLAAVDCWEARDCTAVGVPQIPQADGHSVSTLPQSEVVTIAAGRPVEASTAPFGGWNSISCPAASTCFVAGGGGIVPLVSGRWGVPHPVTGASGLQGISCPTATDCVVTGRYLSEADTGSGGVIARNVDWQPVASGQLVPGTTAMAAVDCWAPGHCEAVGDAGYDAVVVSPVYG